MDNNIFDVNGCSELTKLLSSIKDDVILDYYQFKCLSKPLDQFKIIKHLIKNKCPIFTDIQFETNVFNVCNRFMMIYGKSEIKIVNYIIDDIVNCMIKYNLTDISLINKIMTLIVKYCLINQIIFLNSLFVLNFNVINYELCVCDNFFTFIDDETLIKIMSLNKIFYFDLEEDCDYIKIICSVKSMKCIKALKEDIKEYKNIIMTRYNKVVELIHNDIFDINTYVAYKNYGYGSFINYHGQEDTTDYILHNVYKTSKINIESFNDLFDIVKCYENIYDDDLGIYMKDNIFINNEQFESLKINKDKIINDCDELIDNSLNLLLNRTV